MRAFASRHGFDIVCVRKHRHKTHGWLRISEDFTGVLHEWARISKRTMVMKLIQMLPNRRHLLHKVNPPFADSLKDHILVVLRPTDS